jgi:hypothetical protein
VFRGGGATSEAIKGKNMKKETRKGDKTGQKKEGRGQIKGKWKLQG